MYSNTEKHLPSALELTIFFSKISIYDLTIGTSLNKF